MCVVTHEVAELDEVVVVTSRDTTSVGPIHDAGAGDSWTVCGVIDKQFTTECCVRGHCSRRR